MYYHKSVCVVMYFCVHAYIYLQVCICFMRSCQKLQEMPAKAGRRYGKTI